MLDQPNSIQSVHYATYMADEKRHPANGADSKAVLWAAVSALMRKHYGRENLQRLARDCKFAPATATRIKKQETSVGIEVLEQIAEAFHLHAWQLLVPGFDPKNPPVLQPVTARERKFYDRIMQTARELAAEEEKGDD